MEGRNLIVVAHPDDETLFFAGLIMNNRQCSWDVICATDGNGDGRGDERIEEFNQACKTLGANPLGFLNYPDVFDTRLDIFELKQDIFERLDNYNAVFTHGPLGEYGHPHHQDTSMAVHEAGIEKGIPVWSVAYNSKPDLVVPLDVKTYGIKLRILVEIYEKETIRFMNFLNCSYAEAFAKVGIEEVRSYYRLLTEGVDFGTQLMPHHGMVKNWVRSGEYQSSVDSFFNHYFENSEDEVEE